mmetsp:Transcript_42327/g.98509  ORF Transcript_42327/g.98509 Transcript_42327/m.98509 type:complete len:255 (+) Transcript_42327:1942-2706(+)
MAPEDIEAERGDPGVHQKDKEGNEGGSPHLNDTVAGVPFRVPVPMFPHNLDDNNGQPTDDEEACESHCTAHDNILVGQSGSETVEPGDAGEVEVCSRGGHEEFDHRLVVLDIVGYGESCKNLVKRDGNLCKVNEALLPHRPHEGRDTIEDVADLDRITTAFGSVRGPHDWQPYNHDPEEKHQGCYEPNRSVAQTIVHLVLRVTEPALSIRRRDVVFRANIAQRPLVAFRTRRVLQTPCTTALDDDYPPPARIHV